MSVVISDKVKSIGKSAFAFCYSLNNVVIGNSVRTIGNDAFLYCRKLTDIIIPASVRTIGESAFSTCRSLKRIVLPEGVKSIGEKALVCCESLESVWLPDSVTSIGENAFEGCDQLQIIRIPNTVTELSTEIFDGLRSHVRGTYFMYPYALIYVDNNYYLLAFDTHGRRRHFRVDRMEEVRIHTWSFSREKYDAKVDLEHYTKYTFSMYGNGDIVRVNMRFDNDLVSMVLDRFGHDIMLVKDGNSHFTITEPIAVSPQFFAWIFGLGEKAEIIGPVEVRDQMRKMMEKMIKRYKPEQ